MTKQILILFFAYLFVLNVYAQHAVRVLSSTKTGHTLLLNIGSLEGVKRNSIGKIFANIGSERSPNIIEIGRAQSVKLEADKSYWFIKNPITKVAFEKDAIVLLYLKDQIYNGLGNIKVTRKEIIIPINVSKKTLKRNLKTGMPEDLVMAESSFEIGRKLLEKNRISDSHIIASQVNTWKVSSKKIHHDKHGQNYIVKRLLNLEKEKSTEELRKAEEDLIYEEMVNGSTAKINKLYYGIDELYQEQKRDADLDEFPVNLGIINVYNKNKRSLKKEAILSDAAADYIDIEGPLWSASMGDEQLRRFIHNTGISREKIRRNSAITVRLGHEFIFGFSSAMTNSTTQEDLNYRGTGYDINMGYELHMERLSKLFHNFGLEIFLYRGVGFYPIAENINGRFQFGAISAAVNFYIYNRPTTLQKIIWFAGLGIYRGQAVVDSIELTKSYTYQLFSLPIFQTGIKYRFANINDFYGETPIGIGMSAKFSMGATSLSVSDTIDEADALEGSTIINESKLSMAVNVYF